MCSWGHSLAYGKPSGHSWKKAKSNDVSWKVGSLHPICCYPFLWSRWTFFGPVDAISHFENAKELANKKKCWEIRVILLLKCYLPLTFASLNPVWGCLLSLCLWGFRSLFEAGRPPLERARMGPRRSGASEKSSVEWSPSKTGPASFSLEPWKTEKSRDLRSFFVTSFSQLTSQTACVGSLDKGLKTRWWPKVGSKDGKIHWKSAKVKNLQNSENFSARCFVEIRALAQHPDPKAPGLLISPGQPNQTLVHVILNLGIFVFVKVGVPQYSGLFRMGSIIMVHKGVLSPSVENTA